MFRQKSLDLWNRLSGSPELHPTTPSVTSSLALERPDDVDMEAHDAGDARGPAVLESVVHLHELPESYAWAYFERDAGVADIQTPSGHVVANERPVVPRVVRADRVVWKPVVSPEAMSGHRFEMMHNGELQGHIEVFVDAHSVRRAAFVHRTFSKLARSAGMVDEGSLVEYNSPTNHLHNLQTFLATLDPNKLYLPVAEVAVGPAMDVDFGIALVVDPRHARNPTAAVAPAVWRRVREEATAIWRVARSAAEAHNASELGRTGLG
jgi:hypothetical protein